MSSCKFGRKLSHRDCLSKTDLDKLAHRPHGRRRIGPGITTRSTHTHGRGPRIPVSAIAQGVQTRRCSPNVRPTSTRGRKPEHGQLPQGACGRTRRLFAAPIRLGSAEPAGAIHSEVSQHGTAAMANLPNMCPAARGGSIREPPTCHRPRAGCARREAEPPSRDLARGRH